ncbi:MAG: hypothetical protein R3256_05395 [Thalassovita sp.]|nr:hypothetical protein [Thalassovita sp.]
MITEIIKLSEPVFPLGRRGKEKRRDLIQYCNSTLPIASEADVQQPFVV